MKFKKSRITILKSLIFVLVVSFLFFLTFNIAQEETPPEESLKVQFIERTESTETYFDRTEKKFVGIIYPTLKFIETEEGNKNYTNLINAVKFNRINDIFNLSFHNSWLTLRPYIETNGVNRTWQQAKTLCPTLGINFYKTDNLDYTKWGFNISNPSLCPVDYINLKIIETYNLNEDDFKIRDSEIIIKDKPSLDFSDIKSQGYTLSLLDKRTARIGNVSGKLNIDIDPKVKLNTANITQDLTLKDTNSAATGFQIKWGLHSIPVGSQLLEGKACFYIFNVGSGSDYVDNDVRLWRVKNQTWAEANNASDINILEKTNQTTGIIEGNWTAANEWSCFNVTFQLNNSIIINERNFTLRVEDPDYLIDTITTVSDGTLNFGNLTNTSTPQILYNERTAASNQPYLNISYIPPIQGVQGCRAITVPGWYAMNNSILNTSTFNCIRIETNNVDFDCKYNIIDGSAFPPQTAIYLDYRADEVTIRNCNLTQWANYIIRASSAWNIQIYNMTINNSGLSAAASGIYLYEVRGAWIENVVIDRISGGSSFGLHFYNSKDNNATSINITNIPNKGIRFYYYSSNNIISNSSIKSNAIGISIDSSSSNNNRIYNNFFNNTNNIYQPYTTYNAYNITRNSVTNIVGGATTSGNYWGSFAESPITCPDPDGDGICNSNYTIAAGNIDYSPLSPVTAADIIPPDIVWLSYPQGRFNGYGYFEGYVEDNQISKNASIIMKNGTQNWIEIVKNTTQRKRISIFNKSFNSNQYEDNANLTFNLTGYDSQGNHNSSSISVVIDHSAPLVQINPFLLNEPWITPKLNYYKEGQTITLRINTSDESGAGIAYTNINISNLNKTQYSNMTPEFGQLNTAGKNITFKFDVTLKDTVTGLNQKVDFSPFDGATPTPNSVNHSFSIISIDNENITWEEQSGNFTAFNNSITNFRVNTYDTYALKNYTFEHNITTNGAWNNATKVDISGVSYFISQTFTPQYVGNFSYAYTICDEAGNCKRTQEWIVEVIKTELFITQHFPPDNLSTTQTTNLFLNWSYGDQTKTAINCSVYIDEVINKTFANPINNTIYSLPLNFSESKHIWDVECLESYTGGDCYQETANISTACGGLNTGTYEFITITTPINSYDGDWATSTTGDGTAGAGTININYTKPSKMTSGSLWQVKDGDGTVNLTINEGCLGYDDSKLVFQARWSGPGGTLRWNCYNGTAYITLRESAGESTPVFEEAMSWDIAESSVRSDLRTFIVDTTRPELNITYPLNTTYTAQPIKLDYTINDTNLQACWYSINGGITNSSTVCGQNISELTPAQGSHTYMVAANDSAGNKNESYITFLFSTADTQAPYGYLKAPENGSTEITITVWFASNWTDNQNLSNGTLYIWDSSASLINTSHSGGMSGLADRINQSMIFPKAATYFWNYLGCDLSNNCAFNRTNYTISIESTPPTFSQVSSNFSMVFNESKIFSVDFNATDNGAIDTFHINWTEKFSINSLTGVLTNTTSLGATTYRINVSVNDTANNYGFLIYTVEVNKSALGGTVTSSAGWNINYGTSTTISTSESNVGDADVTYSVSRNNVSVGTGETVTLAAGNYHYLLNSTTSGLNYSFLDKINDNLLIVSRVDPNVTIYIDGLTANKSVASGTKVWLNATRITGDASVYIELFQNGTRINNNTSPVVNQSNFTALGDHNITAYYEETQNYSSKWSYSFYVNVTQYADTTPPTFTNILSNISYIYGTQNRVDRDFNATDTESSISSYQINYTQKFNITSDTGWLQNITDLGVGTYLINVSANDTANNYGFMIFSVQVNQSGATNITLYIDGLTANKTIAANSTVWLNATLITGGKGYLDLYNNGTLINNASTSPAVNLTNFTNGGTSFNITSLFEGNENYTSNWSSYNLFVDVTLPADITPPTFTTISQNRTFAYRTYNLSEDFNATDNVAISSFQINYTEKFSITAGAGILTSIMELGVSDYLINVSVNDTSNNFGFLLYNISVTKGDPKLTLTSSASLITYGTSTTVTGANMPTELTETLTINGTSVSNPHTATLGAGNWIYNYSTAGNMNYTGNSTTIMVNVSQSNAGNVTLYIDGLTQNKTLYSGQKAWLNATLITGDTGTYLELYEQGIIINNGTTPVVNYTNFTLVGSRNITARYIGSNNYSAFGTYTLWVDVVATLDTTPPTFTNVLGNISYVYELGTVSRDFNATDNIAISSFQVNYTEKFNITADTGWLQNFTSLGVGFYNINVSVNDTANNFGFLIFTVEVNQSSNANITIYINNLTQNLSVNSGTKVWINASLINNGFGYINLFENGSRINNASYSAANFTNFTALGDHNITGFFEGNVNYSAKWGNYSFYVNVTSVSYPCGENIVISKVAEGINVTGIGNVNISCIDLNITDDSRLNETSSKIFNLYKYLFIDSWNINLTVDQKDVNNLSIHSNYSLSVIKANKVLINNTIIYSQEGNDYDYNKDNGRASIYLGTYNLTIENTTFLHLGNKTWSAPNAFYGVLINFAEGEIYNSNFSHNYMGIIITGTGLKNSNITNNYFFNQSYDDIYVSSSNTNLKNVTIKNNKFKNPARYGIEHTGAVVATVDWNIINNTFDLVTVFGSMLIQTQRSLIANNTITSNGSIYSVGLKVENKGNSTIEGNIIKYTQYNIWVKNMTNVTIRNNTIENGDMGSDIRESNEVYFENNTIKNMTFNYDGYDVGIKIKNSSNIYLTGNNWSEIATTGILVMKTKNVTIKDNYFYTISMNDRSKYLATDFGDPACAISIVELYKSYLGNNDEIGWSDNVTHIGTYTTDNVTILNNNFDSNTLCYLRAEGTTNLNAVLSSYWYRKFRTPDYLKDTQEYYISDSFGNLTSYYNSKINSTFKSTFNNTKKMDLTIKNISMKFENVNLTQYYNLSLYNLTQASPYNVTFWDNWTVISYNDTVVNITIPFERYVIVTALTPSISIVYPLNQTYRGIVYSLNYTVSSPILQSCWYSINGGTTNTTITCGNNVSLMEGENRQHTWLVGVNDSLGNSNFDIVRFVIDITETRESGGRGTSGVQIVREKPPIGDTTITIAEKEKERGKAYKFIGAFLEWIGTKISKKNSYFALSFIFFLIAILIIFITKFKYIKERYKKFKEKNEI